jgi:hypothetical protein
VGSRRSALILLILLPLYLVVFLLLAIIFLTIDLLDWFITGETGVVTLTVKEMKL